MAKKQALPDFSWEKRFWRRGYDLVVGVDEVGRGALAGLVVAGAVAMGPGGSVISSRARPPGLRTLVYSGSSVRNLALPRAAKNYPRHQSEIISWENLAINDSKKLTPKRRQQLDKLIRKYALAYGIGQGSVAEINRLGIVKATERAMRRAIAMLLRKCSQTQEAGSGRQGKRQEARARREFSSRPQSPVSNLDSRLLLALRSLGEVGSPASRTFVLIDAFHVKYIPGVGLKNQLAVVKGDQKVLSIAAASIVAKVYRDRIVQSLSLQSKYMKYHWRENKGYGTKKHLEAIRKYGRTKLHRLAFVKKLV